MHDDSTNDVLARDQFATKGYAVIRRAMSVATMDLLHRYARSQLLIKGYFELDPRTVSMGRYADGMGEVLLMELLDRLAGIAAGPLLPTYSFLRFYTPDSTLPKHVDRPSCEISATMTIGYRSDMVWPIFVESDGMNVAVPLEVGDLMVYKGIEIPHWREPLPQGYWLQLFCHYVRADGALVRYRFDECNRIGPWQSRRGR